MTDTILSDNARAKLEEIRQRVRTNMKATAPKRTLSLETRQKLSLAAKNISLETRQKRREMMSQIFTCIHCGKVGKGYVMYRHHFDNCKQKA